MDWKKSTLMDPRTCYHDRRIWFGVQSGPVWVSSVAPLQGLYIRPRPVSKCFLFFFFPFLHHISQNCLFWPLFWRLRLLFPFLLLSWTTSLFWTFSSDFVFFLEAQEQSWSAQSPCRPATGQRWPAPGQEVIKSVTKVALVIPQSRERLLCKQQGNFLSLSFFLESSLVNPTVQYRHHYI